MLELAKIKIKKAFYVYGGYNTEIDIKKKIGVLQKEEVAFHTLCLHISWARRL